MKFIGINLFCCCSASPFPKYNIKCKDFMFYDEVLCSVENLIGLINSDMKK